MIDNSAQESTEQEWNQGITLSGFPPPVFWINIILMMAARAWLSWDLLSTYNYVFTLSADDIARARLAMLWAEEPSFFVGETWPPLPFILGGFISWFTSFDIGVLCIVNTISSLLTVVVVGYSAWWWVSYVETNVIRASLFSTVPMAVFVFFPGWVWLGTSMLAEPLYILCLTAGLYTFRLAVMKKHLGWSFLTLIFGLLSNMSRLEGIAFTGTVFALLIIRLFDRKSLKPWYSFVGFGLLLFLAFPIAWLIHQAEGSRGITGYFEALQSGFTSQHLYGLLKTPKDLFFKFLPINGPATEDS